MTDPREELQALRRLAELEAKAGGGPDFSNVQGAVGETVPAKKAEAEAFYNRSYDPVVRLIGGALDGLQHHVGNIPTAIAQAGANTGDWLGNKLLGERAPSMSELVSGKKPSFADRMNAGVKKRESDYQRRTDETPSSKAGSYAGAAVGEVMPWMVGMGQLRTAGALPTIAATGAKGLAQKAALLAAEGGAMGAMQPVTDGEYGSEKARQIAIGAVAAPATAGMVSSVGRGARYLTPSGRDAIAA